MNGVKDSFSTYLWLFPTFHHDLREVHAYIFNYKSNAQTINIFKPADFNYINSCVRHQQMLFPLCPVQCISGRISLKNTHNPSNLRKLPATCVNPHPLWTPAAGEPCCLPYVNGAERRTYFVSSFIISLSSEVLHGQITSSGRGRGREGGGGQAEERICSGAQTLQYWGPHLQISSRISPHQMCSFALRS